MKIVLVSSLLFMFMSAGAIAFAQVPGYFEETANMISARFAHTATLLPNGKVLIAGGFVIAPAQVTAATAAGTASAELYDPDNGVTFIPTGSMAAPRAWQSAALLPDGRVLIVGGSTDKQ